MGEAIIIQLDERIRGPVAVIGDVHGQVEELLTVLDRLKQRPDYEQRWIVFIGDLVDRGPDSKGVMDVVSDLLMQHSRTTVVCGNHELAMAGALQLLPVPDYTDWPTRWMADYGAEPTFTSFGVEPGDLGALRASLSDQHVELLSNLPWCVEHPEYLFVHAGLDPHTPFEMQLRILRKKDFTLNRPAWLCSKGLASAPVSSDCPFTVVSGHVQVPEVIFKQKRLLIDTTGGFGGDLSCVLLPENQVITSGNDSTPRTVAASSEQSSKTWWKIW
jgi:serine/threonine protein phosphatase 1